MDQPEKRIQIEPPLEAANSDKERYQQNAEEECDINNLPNEMLDNIFQHLNYRDLMSAVMVCRKWLECVNREKSIKERPYCFITSQIPAIEAYIRKLSNKPFVAFFFLNYAVNNIYSHILSFLYLQMLRSYYFIHILLVLIRTYCVEWKTFSLVCAFLPQISNFHINAVTVTNQLREETYVEYKQMIKTVARENHESSMCLILFCDSISTDLAWPMIKIAKSTFDNNKKVSLFGGVMNVGKQIEPSQGYCTNCVALFITGQIRTWSIVLDIRERKSAEEKLQTFKQQVKLQKHTFGFVLFPKELWSLSARDKELTIFKKLFPNIPLIGCSSLLEAIFTRSSIKNCAIFYYVYDTYI